MKKDYYLLIDTETTINETVVDFGAVVCDRKGRIVNQCAVLIRNIFGVDPLFYLTDKTGVWSKQNKDRRFTAYEKMLDDGSRMLASVTAVNRWLERVRGEYDPILTAYNLSFDLEKCKNTGIDLTMFTQSFCLWKASKSRWSMTKKYKNFMLSIHAFNNRTPLGNLSFSTNAENMARFILDEPDLMNEPHTAFEDVIYYELPILKRLIATTKKKDILNPPLRIGWKNTQMKDHFKAV